MRQDSVKESYKISPSHLFFIIPSSQIGVGILGFGRIISKYAGYDGWVSVIIAGISVNVLLWMIYKLLKNGGGSIITVHENLLGKRLGGFLSLVFLVFFFLSSASVCRTYIEIIQVWMFPDLPAWLPTVVLMLLVYYIISGGFRVVVGICVFGFILPYWLIFSLIYPMFYGNLDNLLPMFTHTLPQLLKGAKQSAFTFLGFEMILMYYPFIKNPERSEKFAQFGAVMTTSIYLLAAFSTYMFFTPDHLEKSIWSHLTMSKIIELPVMERFEYIKISWWVLVVIPNITLPLWAASRGIKEIFHIKQKKPLVILLILVVVSSFIWQNRKQIDFVDTFTGEFGFYLMYAYLPILFLFQIIKNKAGKQL